MLVYVCIAIPKRVLYAIKIIILYFRPAAGPVCALDVKG
jgi:hypothetical protein